MYNTSMLLLASLQDNMTPRQGACFSFPGEDAGSTSLTAGSSITALLCLKSQQVNMRVNTTTVPEIVAFSYCSDRNFVLMLSLGTVLYTECLSTAFYIASSISSNNPEQMSSPQRGTAKVATLKFHYTSSFYSSYNTHW